MRPPSWLEASARERVAGLLDHGSFVEILGPEMRETSPHLALFDLPVAFDDGVIAGRGSLAGRPVLIAAQEGRFMGGTFGEVSGAKIVGLLRAATAGGPDLVLLALDSGGVRLQEANAGELAVSETTRAIIEARARGVQVVALVGGRAGAFGGAGIVAACCSRIVISQHGRTGVTGPEVIETNKGVEEFDSRDRSLVWRITGGRTRCLLGGADRYVRDEIPAFREAAMALSNGTPLDLPTLRAEQERLRARIAAHGDARDATAIWTEDVGELDEDAFGALLASVGGSDVAR
jgi:malonate decarboxylase beta subunit